MKNKKSYEISIIIPVFNSEKYIERCLLSIEKSIFRDYEVIIVDDGSADDSINIANRFKSRFNVRIRTQKNSGPGSARNAGINIAKGKYIYFLDSDCEIKDDTISILYNFLLKSKDPCLGCVCGPVEISHDQVNIIETGDYYATWYDFSPHDNTKVPKSLLFTNALFRREVFKRCGLINTKAVGGEDGLFHSLLIGSGFTIISIGNALCYHHGKISFSHFIRHGIRIGYDLVNIVDEKKNYRFRSLYHINGFLQGNFCLYFICRLFF